MSIIGSCQHLTGLKPEESIRRFYKSVSLKGLQRTMEEVCRCLLVQRLHHVADIHVLGVLLFLFDDKDQRTFVWSKQDLFDTVILHAFAPVVGQTSGVTVGKP